MIISTRCLVRRRCRSQGTNSGSPEGLRATAKSFEISTTGTTASILRRSKDATRNKCIATNKCRASSNKKLLETISEQENTLVLFWGLAGAQIVAQLAQPAACPKPLGQYGGAPLAVRCERDPLYMYIYICGGSSFLGVNSGLVFDVVCPVYFCACHAWCRKTRCRFL